MDDFDVLKLDHQLCFPLYACSKEIIKRYTPFLDELGLTYTQYITMLVLWEHKTLTVKELGAAVTLDSGTLTPLLKKLESQHLLVRTRDRIDERRVIVNLTEKGTALRTRALTIPQKIHACLNIDQKDAEALYLLLNKVMHSFNETDEAQ